MAKLNIKLIKKISLIAVCVASVGVCSGVMISSYLDYQEYYNAIMEEKANQDYLDSLKLELVSIHAELNDGIEFYKGDNCVPSKNDLFVRATFTEKGKTFDKILSADDYQLTVPADFVDNGGKIKISYTFVRDKEENETEDPIPVTKEFEIDVTLADMMQTVNKLEAEDSQINGGTSKNVNGYLNGVSKNVGVVENFVKGNTLLFSSVESKGVSNTDFSLTLANNSLSDVKLQDIIDVTVNGNLIPIYATVVAKKSDKQYDFVDYKLQNVLLKKGQNNIEITIKEDCDYLALDSIELVQKSRGESLDMTAAAHAFDLSVGDYFLGCQEHSQGVRLTATPSIGDNGKVNTTSGIYAMGAVSDGEYVYFAMDTSNNKQTYLYKADPKTFEIYAKSEVFTVATSSGDNARMFIKDGKVYCLSKTGELYYIKTSEFTGMSCPVLKETSSPYSAYGTAMSISYNESIDMTALMTNDSYLHILDKNNNIIGSKIELSYPEYRISSLTSDDKYIYVNYTEDGKKNMPIDVYTWNGVKVGTLTVGSFQLFPGSGSLAFSVQAMYIHDGEIHTSVCGWGTDSKFYHDWTIKLA